VLTRTRSEVSITHTSNTPSSVLTRTRSEITAVYIYDKKCLSSRGTPGNVYINRHNPYT
jgi:hypothetical protein